MPLRSLVGDLTKSQLKEIARVHKIDVPYRCAIKDLIAVVANHECHCEPTGFVFNVLNDHVEKQAASHRARNAGYKANAKNKPKFKTSEALRARRKLNRIGAQKRKDNDSYVSAAPTDVPFPPAPANINLRHSIISDMCADFDPIAFEEMGCAVCGRLCRRPELTPLEDLEFDRDLLIREGVTRKERGSAADAVSGLDGPILATGCTHACTDCEAKLVVGVTPTHSLANHLWIGEVPWQLKDLTWAEKMMIAKVRHNRCVIRVASGRGKLVANAIMFATPVRKVYQTLPLARDELSEVLAFVFLGSAKPTEEDFVRTPMFLNHRDYQSLEISQTNLNDLPEAGIPCTVEWKQTEDGDTNLVPEAMSVDNPGDVDEGTSSGPCSFAMKALDHLRSGGKTLGIGQAETPESTFHNLQLYPQTFPWLFPYGHGGIGHPAHKRFISEDEHKRHLLMYHDKRFQLDMYFPMVAFNDAQIKQAKTGSHLLVDRKKFQHIADRLSQIEPQVLADLAQRLEQGEHIKEKTEAEQACFDLLEDLEH
ncbi:hypothetical protein DFH08DRAFT_715950, partial [Mycena albidolilacea]